MTNLEKESSVLEHIGTYNKRNRSEERSEVLENHESYGNDTLLVHASASQCKDASTDNGRANNSSSTSCLSSTCLAQSSTILSSEPGGSAAAYEKEHVRDVYNAIASHFSATRYKAWPRIQEFLETLPPYVMIADVGCGNGKYFASCQRRREFDDNNSTTTSSSESIALETCNELERERCELQANKNSDKISNSTYSNTEKDKESITMPLNMPANSDFEPTLSKTCHETTANNKNNKYIESSKSELLAVKSIAKTYPVRRYIVGLDVSENLLRLTQRAIADPNYINTTENDEINDDIKKNTTHTSVRERWKEPLPRTDVICADGIHCPLRGSVFDVVICIAVIHHYSNVQRRKAAVQELLRLTHGQGGLVLIYVWAFEGLKMPKGTSDIPRHIINDIRSIKSNTNKISSAVGESEVMERSNGKNKTDANTISPLSDLESVPLTELEEKKIVTTNRMRVNVESGDAMVRWETHAKFDPNQPIYHRYYHLFRQGELE